MFRVVRFSIMEHLGPILCWYADGKKESTKNTIMDSCCTSAGFGFCYYDESGDLCAHFALHINQELGICILSYLTLSPIVADRDRTIMRVFDFIYQHLTEKKVDSLEIESLNVPKEVFTVLKFNKLSESKLLEKRLKV